MPDVAEVLAGVEHGALDPLCNEEIADLAPRADERELVSRLRDGTSARLGALSIATMWTVRSQTALRTAAAWCSFCAQVASSTRRQWCLYCTRMSWLIGRWRAYWGRET